MVLIRNNKPITKDLSISEVGEIMQQREKEKKDIVIPVRSIKVLDEENFYSDEYGKFNMTDTAFRQLCGYMDEYPIPFEYLKKMHSSDFNRFEDVVNYHLLRSQGNAMLRGFDKEDGTLVRGVVSEQYTPFDNAQSLMDFEHGLKLQGYEKGEYEVKTTNITDDAMFLRVVLKGSEVVIGKDVGGVDDKNYVSIDLVNGEIGNRTLGVEASLFRLICTNGMRGFEKVGKIIGTRHVGKENNIKGNLIKSIGQAIDIGNNAMDSLSKTKKIVVQSPYEDIAKYAKQAKLSEATTRKVRENYDIENENNLLSIVNAFTRTARDISNLDNRLKMERLATNIMSKEMKR